MNPLTVVPASTDLQIFQAMPGNTALLLPDAPMFTIVTVTDDYLEISGKTKEELIGRGLLEAFPNTPDDPDQASERRLRSSLLQVISRKEPHSIPLHRYDIPGSNGTYEERYWTTVNKPVLNEHGEVVYIIHAVEDVTLQQKAEQREAQIKSIEMAYGLFMQAPVVLSILKGENLVIELANKGALQLWGKTSEVIGKPLVEAIPEVKEQGIIDLLNKVRTTGLTYSAKEEPVISYINGQKVEHFFDRVYQPYYETGSGKASGVFTMSHEVTELVLSRRKAEENETKYRQLIESMDQAYCSLEVFFDTAGKCIDYRYVEANPTFERQSGLKDAMGKTIRELAPDIESKWLDFYGGVALTGEPIRIIEESKALNKWYEVYAIRIGDAGSRKVGVFFTDITERKKTEETIKKSEENLRNIILHAPVAMCILNGPSHVVEVANERMFQLCGKGAKDMLHKPIFEGLPEAKNQGLEQLLQHVYSTGETFTANEHPVLLPRNGEMETTYINFVYEPFRNSNGGIEGVMVVAIEVTDQVRARMKIEEANKELQFVTDTMPQLVWATEPDGYSYFFNRGWLDYTGLSFDEVKGDGWTTSLHPDDRGRTFSAWQKAVATGMPYDIEYRLKRKDGVYRWFVARGVPMRNHKGDVIKWYGTSTDIDDQKTVAEALRNSHERFDLVSKATQDAIWDWNLVTNDIWWNEGFRNMFGYTEEEIEPTIESWYNRVHPEDAGRVVGGIHKVIDSGDKQWTDEYRFRKKDGSYAVVLDRGYALHDDDGCPYRMLGSMQDITERTKAEEALNYQKTLLETVTSNTTLALFMLDDNRNCIYMNQAAEKMTGYAFSELNGRNLHDYIHHSHPDGRPYPFDQCPMVCALPRGEQIEGEEVFVHKAGRFYTVAYMASPIILNGSPVGTVLEVRDITEEKKREQELMENELRFRQVANSLPIVIWMALPDGSLTFISDQWEDEFGNPIQESLGTGWAKFVHPDDIACAAEVWSHSLKTGEDYEVEFRVMHKSGEYRWVLVRAIPIRDTAGNIVQWYGSNTDIQENKQFEEQLERRVKERTHELEQFTFVSHHDLQEPLRKMVMFTDMIKSEAYEKMPETSQKRLDKVIDAARRMSQALKDVLNFASLDKEEQFGKVNLEEVLTTICSDLELLIREKKANVYIDDLPVLKAVPAQMHQLFYNLVNNALKFSKADQSPLITIDCRTANSQETQEHAELDQSRQYYLIAVKDNGIGFKQDSAEKIFTMFQRLHNKDAYAGTGIGLALCKKIVLNHGGKIWAWSSEGNGAVFNMLLPVE